MPSSSFSSGAADTRLPTSRDPMQYFDIAGKPWQQGAGNSYWNNAADNTWYMGTPQGQITNVGNAPWTNQQGSVPGGGGGSGAGGLATSPASRSGFPNQSQSNSGWRNQNWSFPPSYGWSGFNPMQNLPMLSNPSLTMAQKNQWLQANPSYQMNSYQMDPSTLARMQYEQNQGLGGWGNQQQFSPQQPGAQRLDFNPYMNQQQNYGGQYGNQMGNVNLQNLQILLQLLSLLGGR